MQDFRKDEITYEEDWQSFDQISESLIIENKEQSQDVNLQHAELEKPSKKKEKRLPLITIQLVLCLIIALIIFILKSMDSDVYYALSRYYDEEMCNTVVSDETFENIDLSEYFTHSKDLGSSKDEV